MSRELVCNDCEETVEVFEEPYEFTDEARFVCLRCLEDRARPTQAPLELGGIDGMTSPIRQERLAYNPDQARIPF